MDPFALELPEPEAAWTIPVAVGLGVLALLALVKKLVALALVAALLAGGFLAYQAGALDEWVDKGKNELDRRDLTAGYPPVISES